MLATSIRVAGLSFALLLVAGCPSKQKTELEPIPAADAATSRSALTVEGCVDAWLEQHHLDRYGNPEGTMYAGGTPLFDERTGQRRDRLSYVFSKQPESQSACARDAGVVDRRGPATR